MKTIKGDLIQLAKDGEFDIIIHGCNCFCTMGAGIARKIAEEFPSASAIDETTEYGDVDKLGSWSVGSFWRDDGTLLTIFNAYTQFGISSKGEQVVNYDAVRKSFRSIARITKVTPDNTPYTINLPLKIGYPMIGAGLGGGDWNIISAIIDEEFEGLDHTLVEYDGE